MQLTRVGATLLAVAFAGVGCGRGPFFLVDDELDGATDACSGDLDHGAILIEFHRVDGLLEDPFVGTSVIQLTLNYEACLIEFYDENRNWRFDGHDGAAVFGSAIDGCEGWEDRLCDGRGGIDCSVISFNQRLDGATRSSLSVLYEVGGAIEDRELYFGPVPLAALADCEGGERPTMRIPHEAARGLDGVPPDGNVLWKMQKFDPDRARAGLLAAISIDVEPAD